MVRSCLEVLVLRGCGELSGVMELTYARVCGTRSVIWAKRVYDNFFVLGAKR
jgi:hypothetical protein